MDLNDKNWDDFDHARWRVQFLRHLLEMHQTSPKRNTEAWNQEEKDYEARLMSAEKELERYPREWHTLSRTGSGSARR